MQQNERKGAWTLFVAILIFGALVWGYGGYEREKARTESVKVTSEMPGKIVETDSAEYHIDKSKNKRGKKENNKGGKRRKGKTKGKGDAKEPVRDILADPIKTDSE